MKHLKYMSLLLLLILLLTACHKEVNSTISSVDSTESVDESSLIDITEDVNERKLEYEFYLNFGKKHGLLYENGKQTNGVPIMEEIVTLKEGDKVNEKTKIVVSHSISEMEYLETDVNILYDTIKDLVKDDIYEYLYEIDLTVPDEIGEVDWKDYIDYALCNIGYNETGEGILSIDEYVALNDDEFKNHVARVLSYYNSDVNKHRKEYSDSQQNESDTIAYSDGFDEMDKDYQKWYIDNLETIVNVRTIDFTKEVLPKEVIIKNNKYYIDKKTVKREENGNIILNIYGKDLYF